LALLYYPTQCRDCLHCFILARGSESIIDSDSEAAYWGDRDCCTMHDMANKKIQSRAIEGITA